MSIGVKKINVIPRKGNRGNRSREKFLYTSLVLEGVQPNILVDCSPFSYTGVDYDSVDSFVLGVVLTSLKKGWGRVADENVIYNAYSWMVIALRNSMKGIFPTISVAPRWFWVLVDALTPTTARDNDISVSYRWKGVQTAPPPPIVDTGALQVHLGSLLDPLQTVNGLGLLATPLYDEQVGLESFQSMFNFYSSQSFFLQRVPYAPTPLLEDSSAFAAVEPVFGGSYYAAGGVTTLVRSEFPIAYPLLARFAGSTPQNEFRGLLHLKVGSGSPSYIFPRMIELDSISDLQNPVRPIFKFFEFEEYYAVLSETLVKACDITAQFNASGPEVRQCPLTSQQVRLLLRQSILPYFSNHMAQDLVFDQLVGEEITNFAYPFSVGQNGVADETPSLDMLLPTCFAEGVRAVSRYQVKHKAGLCDYVPVLSSAFNSIFAFNYRGQFMTHDLYAPEGTEAPIDLFRCTAPILQYLSLSSNPITRLASVWNEWLVELSSVLSPLVSLGCFPGIPAYNVLSKTLVCERFAVSFVPPLNTGNSIPLSTVVPSPLGFTRFRDSIVTAIQSATDFSPDWEVMKCFIVPTVTQPPQKKIPLGVYQAFYQEPFSLSANGIDVFYPSEIAVSLDNRHDLMSSYDIRGTLSASSDLSRRIQAYYGIV